MADSSLRYDRGTKQRVYATAGVPAYVIVNIPEERVELYDDAVPKEGRYGRRREHGAGDILTLLLTEGRTLRIGVADILGPLGR